MNQGVIYKVDVSPEGEITLSPVGVAFVHPAKAIGGLKDPGFKFLPEVYEAACVGLEERGFRVDREAKTFEKATIGRYAVDAVSLTEILEHIVVPLGLDPHTFADSVGRSSAKGRSFVPLRVVGDALRNACDDEQEPRAQRLLISAVPSVDWVELDY